MRDIHGRFKNHQQRNNSLRDEMVTAIVGQVVMTKYNNLTYRIDDVDFNHDPMTTFDCRGRAIS